MRKRSRVTVSLVLRFLNPCPPQRRQRRALRRSLAKALTNLHPAPSRLTEDDTLLDYLIGLYGCEVGSIWERHVAPFVNRHRAELGLVFRENAVLHASPLLDDYASLLLLERLAETPQTLQTTWPLPLVQLREVAQAWASPLELLVA